MLVLDDVHCSYGRIAALKWVSLRVEEGEIVCLIGANGAGKSTTLMAISGIVPVSAGSISFRGEALTRTPPSERVRRGIVQAPEGRRIFADMTVRDNLLMGAHLAKDPARIAEDLGVSPQQVNIKAKTNERLGFLGREEGIAAEAVALIYRK